MAASGAYMTGYDFVVVANRLAVNRITEPDGTIGWVRSPGGLVTLPWRRSWRSPRAPGSAGAGAADEALEPFDHSGLHLHPVPLSAQEVEDYYEGFSDGTLWPLYHDVIARPQFHRHWFDAYRRVESRFAAPRSSGGFDGRHGVVQLSASIGSARSCAEFRRSDPEDRLLQPHPVPTFRGSSPSCRGAAQ